jgi:hypothetical protein
MFAHRYCLAEVTLLLFVAVSQTASAQDGCKARFAIQPFDIDVLRVLGPAAAPMNPNLLSSKAFVELRNWNFPSKVTSWTARPSAEELTRRREELTNPATDAGNQTKKASMALAVSVPYKLQSVPPRDWNNLEKWFAKEVPKKITGACVDRDKATYVIAIGVISDGTTDSSLMNSSRRNEYGQSASAQQQDAAVGPNAGMAQVRAANSQEMNGMGGNGGARSGTYTCSYFYRAQGGIREQTPAYYYCMSGEGVPRSAVSAMLKYIAGTNLP